MTGNERPDWNGNEVVPAAPDEPAIPESLILTKEEGQAITREIEARHTRQPVTPSEVPPLDPDMLARWDATGGTEYHLSIAQGAAQTAVDSLLEEDRAEFQNGYDGLPEGVRTAIVDHLSVPPLRPGNKADALRRLQLIEADLTSGEIDAAAAWLEILSPEQKQAVLKGLSG